MSDDIKELHKKAKELYYGEQYKEAFDKNSEILQLDPDDKKAQHHIGVMYAEGEGVKRNYAKAVKLFRMSAENGFSNAQYNLGWMYFFGKGIKQNYTKAESWWRLAAEQNDEYAQYNLGRMYSYGHCVKQNYDEAEKWFSLAAELGCEQSKEKLKELEALRNAKI
jgi:hypothetical protein